MAISRKKAHNYLAFHRKRIGTISKKVQSLIPSVLEPVDGMAQETNTAKKSSTILLVNLLVVPNGYCHRVCLTEVEVVVLIPFRV